MALIMETGSGMESSSLREHVRERKTNDSFRGKLAWPPLRLFSLVHNSKGLNLAAIEQVNILRGLRTPFVVRYHDRIVDKPLSTLYIVMEHCAGGDLGQVIAHSHSEL